ncbi:uncharacterized protein A1O9_11208 [Exophiala aquamarina CBS 119918]|uniref:Fe2OG dioxygenase domain-containing protein n=1 Tax=Exophiala aquamarina CBS 119918 TaxID=1182545 RepID=A0A072NZ10_9EURO|nr:uncharacterized protein A1O9_11208 [Exophiala aquamarina CBS 119918]KEF52791.1 hypothetical protein A1O9_11208 [Exophiala aquamarina CBS 119918]
MGSISDSTTEPNIPIIDLAAFLNPESTVEERLTVAQDLVSACRHVGFVYIKNHGVPQEQLEQVFSISKEFYDLPTEQKRKAPHPPGWSVHRGYSWPGLEKVSSAISATDDEEAIKELREVQDYKESYEIGSEENPSQPNVWPPDDILPEWRPFMTSFYWTCFEAGKRILRALALGIGLDEHHLLKYHNGHYNQLRLLHYPPIPEAAVRSGKFARMPAHTDWSTMTFLFQDDCGGLQVEHPNNAGQFIDVAPIPSTAVMNVGDLLMRWSNDYLKSTMHRVQLPPLQDRFSGDNRMTRARYSIPYFVTTDPDLLIECLRFDEEHPPKYGPITQRDYAAMRARMQY